MKSHIAKNYSYFLYSLLLLSLILAGCGASPKTAPSTLSVDQNQPVSVMSTSQSPAEFSYPYGLAVDSVGNIYVADAGNSALREILPAGKVITIAGKSTGLTQDVSVALNSTTGYLYMGNALEVLVVSSDRSVDILAGSNERGTVNGQGSSARFSAVGGVAVDSKGNIFVADSDNNEIRKVTPDGNVTTFAGSSTVGSADGVGVNASFNSPFGLAIDTKDNLYVADYMNNEIRKITPDGVVTTLAGTTSIGSANGVGNAASFNRPAGIAVDASGTLYIADRYNNEIRKLTPDGTVSTLAGSASQRGSADGTGANASFFSPFGVAVDKNGMVYVADTGNNEIRQVTPAGVVTTIAGSTTSGDVDGTATPR